MHFFRSLTATLIALAGMTALASAQSEPHAKTYAFLTHAAFFSVESKPANLIDPQVFVRDPDAPAATGPQGIPHVAGYRNALGVDNPTLDIENARGAPLHMTLAQWFGARGTVKLMPSGGDTMAKFSFEELVPNGHYSLFENHFSPTGVTFTPADGTATTNSFTATANGTARIELRVPGAVTHAEALLLVYHSDGMDHGMQRGALGVNAHHQLITRVP